MKIVDGIIAVIYVIAMAVLFFLRDCEKDLPMGILALAVTVAAVVVMVIQNKKKETKRARAQENGKLL